MSLRNGSLIIKAMTMSTSPLPSLNRADLESTLARVSSKPNVSGALILTKDTGAIIRSTLADNDLAKKYSLGVKRILYKRRGLELTGRIITIVKRGYEGD
jgi:translation initiation factor 6 (eIF-6)